MVINILEFGCTTTNSSQITSSRQHSQEQFPVSSMRSNSWRKQLDEMPRLPKPNVYFSYTPKKYGITTLTNLDSRAEFEKLRTLLDDINTTTSRIGSQIDKIERNLDGVEVCAKVSEIAVGPLKYFYRV